MNQVEIILERLFEHYNVSSVAELSKVTDTDQKRISNWKTRNSVNAIKKRCRELEIYNDIFKDVNLEQSISPVPQDIVSNLEILFKMAKDSNTSTDEIINNIDDFVHEQKKLLRNKK